MPRKPRSAIERFEEKYIISDNNFYEDIPCWEWTAYKMKSGYGTFHLPEYGETCAHRASYILHKGLIPETFEIDHLCKNTSCVCPEHLEAVTRRENLFRSDCPSALNKRKETCKHGHIFNEENTLFDKNGNRSCRTCNNIKERRKRKNLSPEKLALHRQKAKEYADSHREERILYLREYRKNMSEEKRAMQKAKYSQNRMKKDVHTN